MQNHASHQMLSATLKKGGTARHILRITSKKRKEIAMNGDA
jgi:hypothetical protein